MWKKICTTVLLMFLASIAVSAFPVEPVESVKEMQVEQTGTTNLSAVAEDFAWSLDENGVLTISGHGDMPYRITSQYYDYYSVTMPWYFFSNKITSVIINDGITSIAPSAFNGCAVLTDITIPNSVTTIGNEAFDSCSSLKQIVLPDGLRTIGNSVFRGCTALEDISFPDSIVKIGRYVFGEDEGGNFTVPWYTTNYVACTDEILYTGRIAYRYKFKDGADRSEVSIKFKPGTKGIAPCLFMVPYAKISLYIPDTIEYIAENAFQSPNGDPVCHVYITDLATWCNIDFGENDDCYAFDENAFNASFLFRRNAKLYLNGEAVTHLVIPDGVTKIPNGAFANLSQLTDVTIPDSVTEIGDVAFYGCTNLENITFSKNISKIGCEAFTKTAWYKNQPDGMLYINNIAYHYIGTMPENTTLGIRPGTTGISQCFASNEGIDFSTCPNLVGVTLPESITNIGMGAFLGCVNLKWINIPSSVTAIEASAFSGCSSLESITLPDSVTTIGASAFRGCSSLESITLPDSVTTIGANAFRGCSSLENIMLSDSVTTIGAGAFRDCQALKNVTLSKNLTQIGAEAFYNCTALTGITIPDSVRIIRNSAFEKCSALTSIVIPNGVTAIENNTFYNCTNLASVSLPESLIYISAGAFCSAALEAINIPSNVAYLGDSAFAGTSLKSFDMPNSVTYVGSYAFYSTPLTSIAISNSIAVLGEKAFVTGDEPLNVIIKDGATKVWENAFMNNSSVVSVTIPDSVTTIEKWAFYRCENLQSVTVPSSVTEINSEAFSSTPWYNSLPDGFVYIGKVLYAWKGAMVQGAKLSVKAGTTMITDCAFKNCSNLVGITIPGSVTKIGEEAFSGCTKLSSLRVADLAKWLNIDFAYTRMYSSKDDAYYMDYSSNPLYANTSGGVTLYVAGKEVTDLVIPNEVEHIPPYAFKNCTEITSAVIPNGITAIDISTFSGCTGLLSVTIPESVTEIDKEAFNDCYSLMDIYFGGTEADWKKISIGENNEFLSQATVHFGPAKFKVSFSANTLSPVSSLPDAASAIGAYTLPSVIPMRSGYAFLGWSTVPDGKAAYQPGDTVEISADTTFYAVWAEADKVALSGITLKNTAYDPISTIPTGDFIAEVTLTNNNYTASCTVLLATYDADGRMLDVRYLYADPDTGKTITFGTGLSDPNGKIAKIKAFVLSDLRAFTILGEAAELTKA